MLHLRHRRLPRLAAGVLLLAGIAHADAPSDPPAFRFAEAASVADDVATGDRQVLDLRPIGDYLAGHVPGSVHLDDERLRGPAGGLPVQLLDPAATAAVFAGAGLAPGSPVLLVSTREDPLAATLAAWSLLRLGHDDVAVLDGGWPAWAANHPVTRGYTPSAASSLEPGAAPRATSDARVTVATLEDIREHVGWDTLTFVDARPPAQYRGEIPAWPRAGHIPAAINLPWTRLTEPDAPARLRTRAEIERIVREDVGIDADADVVVYCGTGREATLLALTLEHVLGHRRVRLFAGSWTEYAAHEEMPIEVDRRQPPRVRVHRDTGGEGTPAISFSGQPDEPTLRWLRDQGVRTIVNCRSRWELANRMPYDDSLLTDMGFDVVSIPLGGDDGYRPQDVDRLAAAIASSDGAVHLHCTSGGRARTLWTAWLIRHEGLTVDEAQARAAAVGGGPSSLERLLGERIEQRPTGRALERPDTR